MVVVRPLEKIAIAPMAAPHPSLSTSNRQAKFLTLPSAQRIGRFPGTALPCGPFMAR